MQLDIPEETLISLKTDAEFFARDLKLLAAVKLFKLRKLSSGELRNWPEWRGSSSCLSCGTSRSPPSK